MIRVKISEFEFEVTNKLINGIDVKLKNPEKHKVFQLYELDDMGQVFDLIESFDTLEEAIKFAKTNNMEVLKWKILNLCYYF